MQSTSTGALGLTLGLGAALIAPLPPLLEWPMVAGWTPLVWSCVTVVAVSVFGYVLLSTERAGVQLLWSSIVGVLLAFAAVGGEVTRHWLGSYAGSDWVVEGVVLGPPQRGEDFLRFDLAPEVFTAVEEGALPPTVLPKRVRVSWRSPDVEIVSAQRWRMQLRLDPPEGRLNRGGFDKRAWLVRERVHALASVRTQVQPVLLVEVADAQPLARVGRWRQRLRDQVESLATLSDRGAALVSALALGLRDGLTEELRGVLQATGTSHLLAISGLHISLVFGAVLMFSRAILRHLPACSPSRVWSCALRDAPFRRAPWSWAIDSDSVCVLLALLCAGVYGVLAGLGLPVQRALLMLLLASLVSLWVRHSRPSAVLAIAVIGVLLCDPLAVLSPGFWLSAGAVALILWLSVGRAPRGFTGLIRLQLYIGVAMLLPGALWFQQVSLVAPLANLLAIPLATVLIVPGALMLAVLLPLAPAVASWVATVVDLCMDGLIAVLNVMSALPIGHWPIALSGGVLVLSGLTAIVTLTAPARRPWVGFLPILLLPAVTLGWRGITVDWLELHLLDVGHGLAVIVLTPETTSIIDTGGGLGRTTRMQTDVLPHLLSLGRRRVDHVVVSHADNDHAAGLAPLVAQHPEIHVHASDVDDARRRLDEANLALPASRLSLCEAGRGLALGHLRLDFLHPAPHDRGSRNDRSCVALLHGPGVRVLFPGDIEWLGEAQLLQRAGPLALDLLVAPHHGSQSSSSAAFVQAYPARHVVFPAAKRSFWGFPHEAVQMRYKLAGARLHHTGRAGALTFRFRGAGKPPKVSALGRESQRLWRAPRPDAHKLQLPVANGSGNDH